MARPYRLLGEHYLYHITSRGDDRKKIYVDNSDYKKFLQYILNAKEKYKFYLYAYALMPNHYHLLIETVQPNLSKIMQYINTSYTISYNVKHGRCGHLFQGRYKSILVDKDSYFLELTRYIHLNPVRAKRVQDPEKYRWSSYQGYMKKNGDGYIDREYLNQYLNMSANQYRAFVGKTTKKDDNLFNYIYAGCLLGKETFIKEKLKDLKEQSENKEVSYKNMLNDDIDMNEIIDIVARRYGKEPSEICSTKKRLFNERKITLYLVKRLTSLTNKKIGEKFGISYSAVSKNAWNFEKMMEQNNTLKKKVEELISRFKV